MANANGAPPPPPYYNTQPQPYNPQAPQGGYAPYPAGQYPQQGYAYQQPPQTIIIQEQPRRNQMDDCCCNWLLTLMCGCLIGEICCDAPMLCCYLPIPCPRWR